MVWSRTHTFYFNLSVLYIANTMPNPMTEKKKYKYFIPEENSGQEWLFSSGILKKRFVR